MKYLVSYIIISILFLQSVGNTFFFIDYQISIEKYKASCENIQKPEMKCHGKCQMIKQTKKFGFWESENENQKKAPSLKSVKGFDMINYTVAYLPLNFESLQEDSFFYTNYYFFSPNSLVHPPPEYI